MKLKIILIFTIFSIAVLSCNNKEVMTEHKIIDLSSFGSVNMIKEIAGDIYVLNSTASSIHKLNADSLSLFRDLEIGGRDFLLDFDIEGNKVYYSNTYDQIFISSGNTIEDTIKVFNPDRIAVMDSLLYVTSRKAEDENVLLKLYDIKSKKEISCIPLNDSPVAEMKFAQASICESGNNLWVMNPFRNRLEKYNSDLGIVSILELPQGYEFGNFSAVENELTILAVIDRKIFTIRIYEDKNSDSSIIFELPNDNIDISSSCILQDYVFLYNYIDSKILTKSFKTL
ncbi:TPA: hypothetical protein DCR49_10730 [Candidatus Delongbacteria bacterium]|nr:hypothetical protein [Candidatus Delongbacteria bacterium]